VHQHIEKAIRKLADLQIFSISTSFLLIEKRLWRAQTPQRINLLKSKHILQEKRAE